MELLQLLQILRGRLRLILTVGLVSGLACFAIGLRNVRYEAEATALLRPIGATSAQDSALPRLGLVYSPALGIMQNQGRTYLMIAKSRTVVGQVVEELSLADRYANDSTASRVLDMVKQPLRFLVYGRPLVEEESSVDRAIRKTAPKLDVKLIASSTIVRIRAGGETPRAAQQLANTLLDVFMEHARRHRAQSIQSSVSQAELQLKQTRDTLRKTQASLMELEAAHNVPSYASGADEKKRLKAKIVVLEDSMEQRAAALPVLVQRIKNLKQGLAEYGDFLRQSYDLDNNPAVQRLRDSLSLLGLEMQATLIDFTPESKQVSTLERRIADTRTALTNEISRVMGKETFMADPRRDRLLSDLLVAEQGRLIFEPSQQQAAQQVDAMRKRLLALETAMPLFEQLDRERVTLENHESSLLLQLQNVQAFAPSALSEIDALDRAPLPRYPTIRDAPLSLYSVMAFVVGVVLASSWVVWHRPRSGTPS